MWGYVIQGNFHFPLSYLKCCCLTNSVLNIHSTFITELRAIFEPAHEIMAFFVLRKFFLQPHMRSHPVRLDVWFLIGFIVYFHTSCVRTAKALARLRSCIGSPEPSLVAYVISTIISWAGSFITELKTMFAEFYWYMYHLGYSYTHVKN